MKLGLLLSLVSALQIAQQSIIGELSDFLSETEAAVAGAAFPAGKFFSTIILAFRPIKSSTALVADAWCLIIGSVVTLFPGVWFLVFGRFMVGCGAGLGFVCATVMLFERIDYRDRPAHFCILGLSFAMATFVINLLPLVHMPYQLVIFLVSGLTGLCGAVYLLFRSTEEAEKEVISEQKKFIPTASSFPLILVFSLMVLNVSIGVPIIIGFSSKIFEEFGADTNFATMLSIAFPVLQMMVMLILYFSRSELNRCYLIIGGYFTAILIQFVLLITSSYPFLPAEHHTFFMCAFFFLLVIIVCVPANTALCLIAEQFPNTLEQTRQISWGRAVMWCLATVSTATWMASTHKFGFTVTFFPYFVISVLMFIVVVKIFPKQEV